MQTIIAKEFRWEMGHRLPDHAGLCRNIHGHSYVADVRLCGEPDASGMVMDYFDVKTMVQPLIDELDHCFLCDRSDSVMMDFFATNAMKVVTIDVPSTAENIAAMLLRRIVERLPHGHSIDSVTVRVFETEKTFAEVSATIR
ncbi:MAG: 6-pyruvoyl tetrahydropterin synthase family protein [Candidatus Kapabacteria bacterium]|jgi:6-pyruvoyltetrahydropterin/6-carboxytetrahydropterin synthase|nr:6-pyruvoyl tetrahydropterin synthase family protein [Candidatus Kapabacteria bacterium]